MNYQAKCQYRTKIKFYYTGADTHRMWQGLQMITDYKRKPSCKLSREFTGKFADIFNLSLTQSVIPRMFQADHHSPDPISTYL